MSAMTALSPLGQLPRGGDAEDLFSSRGHHIMLGKRGDAKA